MLNKLIDSQFETDLNVVGVRTGFIPVGSFIFSKKALRALPRARHKWQAGEKLPDLRRCPSRGLDVIDPLPTADAEPAPDKSTRKLSKPLLPGFKQVRQHHAINLFACHRPEGYPDTRRRLDGCSEGKNRCSAAISSDFLCGLLTTDLKFVELILVVALLLE
ncbi:MAG: hypothetical protein DDT39_01494 [Firmicutes bacterium]|nr:hypothetical protein [candidate division NPL-UPA2 bacterium]